MTCRIIAAFAVTGIAITAAQGITVRPAAPTAPEKLLDAIAIGTPTPQFVSTAIAECEVTANSQARCEQHLARVLLEYAASGETEASVVTEGIALAERDFEAAARRIRNAIRSADRTLSPTSADLGVIGETALPRGEDRSNVTISIWQARVDHFVLPLLPPKASDRVARAFEIASASSCGRAFGGTALNVCHDIGLVSMQLSALRLVFRPLLTSEGREAALTPFLLVSSELVERAVMRFGQNDDELISGGLRLVERWRVRKPSRWRAWADLESWFGER